MIKFAILIIMSLIISIPNYTFGSSSRYFYSGDGRINLASKPGAVFSGVYKNPDGSYNDAAMRQIHKIFGAKYNDPVARISPRLIEFFDYLEDNLRPGARITIHSGFRSPVVNAALRAKGKLAAKASLHQYGMAADIKVSGVSSEAVWNFIKGLGVGGAGFYHGSLVHVDVGPARSWDERTSGVDLGLSDDNKLVGIIADKDIYFPGEQVEARFIRVTSFPVGVAPKFTLEKKTGGSWKGSAQFTPAFSTKDQTAPCSKLDSVEETLGITWLLPKDLEAGRYRITSRFCERISREMPEFVSTPEFEVTTGP